MSSINKEDWVKCIWGEVWNQAESLWGTTNLKIIIIYEFPTKACNCYPFLGLQQ